MRCPVCGHEEDRVVDSRTAEDGRAIRRRRECEACGEARGLANARESGAGVVAADAEECDEKQRWRDGEPAAEREEIGGGDEQERAAGDEA